MRNFFFLFVLILASINPLSALESQIILINSEAFLVDLDDNYDVVKVHDRIPEYFQDHSSHEEILATYKYSSNNDDIGYECQEATISTEAIINENFSVELASQGVACFEFNTQSIDNQPVINKNEVSPNHWRWNESFAILNDESIRG